MLLNMSKNIGGFPHYLFNADPDNGASNNRPSSITDGERKRLLGGQQEHDSLASAQSFGTIDPVIHKEKRTATKIRLSFQPDPGGRHLTHRRRPCLTF